MRALTLATFALVLFAARATATDSPRGVVVILDADAPLLLAPGGAPIGLTPALADVLARHQLASGAALDGGAARYVRFASAAPEFDAIAAARELSALAGVRAAAPDLSMRLAITTPNDPFLSQQWAFSTSVATVRARWAWDTERGDSNVVIAIVDTGVDGGHPDLAAKIWRNPGEIAGNGLDDDGNGRVDDVRGWDFGNDDANANPDPFFDPLLGIDEGFHGTFCAGLAAAGTNNGTGMAGMAWGCKIMPLKVNDTTGDISLAALTGAFAYAGQKGAKVLNLSLGTTDTTARAVFQALVNDAFNAGVVCVAAAGNDGTDDLSFPAACESVLSVGATNPSNGRASFSNWGPTIDIAAPGEGMFSSICRNYEIDETSALFYELLFGWDGVNPYMFGDGTSFACPLVAGACALVRSRFPALTPLQVQQTIALTGDVVNYDNLLGRRMNVERALIQSVSAPSVAVHHAALRVAPDPMRDVARVTCSLPRAGRVVVDVLGVDGRRVRRLADGDLTAGEHAWSWRGDDDANRPVAAGLYFIRARANGESVVHRLTRLR